MYLLLLILLLPLLLFVYMIIVFCACCMGITRVEKNTSNICGNCEMDVDKIIATSDKKDIELVKYARNVVCNCCFKKREWSKCLPFWMYLVRKSGKGQDKFDDVEMQQLNNTEHTTGRMKKI